MKKVFWLIPGQLAGRPGPDLVPWDLAELRTAGIGAVLSVNDGSLCYPEEFAYHDIAYACVPLADNAPPLPGDVEWCIAALPKAYEFVAEQHRRGRCVLVHCTSGKDRTGMFMSYFLTQHEGLSARQAIASVRRVRPIALSAEGWETLTESVLRHIQ